MSNSLSMQDNTYTDINAYLQSVIYYKNSEQHNSIVYTIEGNKFKKGVEYDIVMKHARITLDKCLVESKELYNKDTVITHLDLSGITMKQIDTGFFKKMIVMLQQEYEDTLEKLIVTNIPVFFKIAYKIVRPFIDKDTKKKIFFEKKSRKGTREFTNNDDILEDL